MHVICLLSQKGGAGKSTVVQSLAVCAGQHGQNTLIVELDPQGTLKDWSKRRKADSPAVLQTLPQSIGDVLDDACKRGVDWVFIDTPGHHNPVAIAAASYADVILIPCKILSMKDVDAILPTIAEAERSQKPAFVVMNQVPPNAPKLVRKRQVKIQEDYGIKVLSLCLSRRADFEYCDEHGLSAAEYNPHGAAAAEIQKLYVLVQAILHIAKVDDEAPDQVTSADVPESNQREDTLPHEPFRPEVITPQPEVAQSLQPREVEVSGTNEVLRSGIPEASTETKD
ncbi:MAG: AAA family ATPase [Gammaproteobacteria bacterium]|nr:AAA family ATPase [Gammaproteobacteria bacterium]